MGVGVVAAVDGDHAVVAGDREQRAGREVLGEQRHEVVDLAQLPAPRERARPAQVTELVEVGVVGVDEPRRGQRRERLRGEVAERAHAAVRRAAQRRARQAGLAVGAVGDDGAGDPDRGGALEQRRVGLHGLRGQPFAEVGGPLGPGEGVEQGAVDAEPDAEGAVRAGRQAGPEARDADRGARREPDGQRARRRHPGEERRVGGVLGEQLAPEPVDEEQRGGPRGRQRDRRGAVDLDAERREEGGERLGERGHGAHHARPDRPRPAPARRVARGRTGAGRHDVGARCESGLIAAPAPVPQGRKGQGSRSPRQPASNKGADRGRRARPRTRGDGAAAGRAAYSESRRSKNSR